MARLIESSMTLELDPVVAGLPVVEFIEETIETELVLVPPRKPSGARLDRSFDVTEWFDF